MSVRALVARHEGARPLTQHGMSHQTPPQVYWSVSSPCVPPLPVGLSIRYWAGHWSEPQIRHIHVIGLADGWSDFLLTGLTLGAQCHPTAIFSSLFPSCECVQRLFSHFNWYMQALNWKSLPLMHTCLFLVLCNCRESKLVLKPDPRLPLNLIWFQGDPFHCS